MFLAALWTLRGERSVTRGPTRLTFPSSVSACFLHSLLSFLYSDIFDTFFDYIIAYIRCLIFLWFLPSLLIISPRYVSSVTSFITVPWTFRVGDSFLCVVMNVFKESDSIPHLAIPLRSSTKASGSILAVPLMKNLNSFKNQDNPFVTLWLYFYF